MQQQIEDGMMAYAEAVGGMSTDDLTAMAYQYKDVKPFFDSEMTAGDTCQLALGSVVVTSDGKSLPCFVAVLQDRVAVAYRQGMFKKTTVSEVVPFAQITDVAWANGTSPRTRNAQIARIVAPGREVAFALPVAQAQMAGQVIKAAILGQGS